MRTKVTDPIALIERAVRKRLMGKLWRWENRFKLNEYSRQYNIEHPEELRAHKRNWARKKAAERREANGVQITGEAAAGSQGLAAEESRETQGATSQVPAEVPSTDCADDAGVATDTPQETPAVSGHV